MLEQGRERAVSVIDNCLTIDVDSFDEEVYSEVFEVLFSPEEGYLRDVPEDFQFRLRKISRFTVGWGTEYSETYSNELTGRDIREMQRKAVEESYTVGYSSEKFIELYEEVM